MEKITIQSKREAIIGGKLIVGFIGGLSFLFFVSLLMGDKKINLAEREGMFWFLFFLFVLAFANGQFFIEEVLAQCRKITLDKDGCTVSWFRFTKRHRWEDLQIVREDCWVSKKREYEGIVFSAKTEQQMKSSRKIYETYDFLNCFYVVFYENDRKSFKYPVKRDEFIKQLNNWGVEIEIGREAILKKRRLQELEEGLKRRKQRLEKRKEK